MRPATGGGLEGARIAFLVANEGIEEAELTAPWHAVHDAGGRPALVAPEPGEAQLVRHLDKSGSWPVDLTTAEAAAAGFDAVVLPGGVANADRLRMDEPALVFLQAMFAAGKPCAVICHGPWSLVEAGLVEGRTLTSWPSVRTDIENAGGRWVDEEVVVCDAGPNLLVSSRSPKDLEAFCSTLVHVCEDTGVGRRDDLVDEAGEESFPASDPPAVTIAPRVA